MLTHQHPELRDMDRWEAEPLSGMSINEIFDKTLTADELGGNLELDTADRERQHEERIQTTTGGCGGQGLRSRMPWRTFSSHLGLCSSGAGRGREALDASGA
jgi:hypothetical protein